MTRLCSTEGCDRAMVARGMCSMHYCRWKKERPSPLGVCSVDDCSEQVRCSGLCRVHYDRQRRHGRHHTVMTPRGECLRWLEDHLSHEGEGCLIWPFTRNNNGYGIVTVEGKQVSAPNYMCRRAHGEPPTKSHEAAHGCGNGHEGCVHPAHLRWATRVENVADKLDHGTMLRGERMDNAKLKEADIPLIRQMRKTMTMPAIAAHFGVSRGTISSVVYGRSWTWV